MRQGPALAAVVLLDGRGDADGPVDAVEQKGLAELGAPRGGAAEDLGVGDGGVDHQPVRRDPHERAIFLVEAVDLEVEVALELVGVVEGDAARRVQLGAGELGQGVEGESVDDEADAIQDELRGGSVVRI